MKKLSLLLVLAAQPAFAAEGPFVTLRNTEFVVLIAFVVFVALLLKLKVPGKLMAMLDKRAANIKADLDEARALREEAQAILASYERKARDVQAQADAIVTAAKRDAELAAEQAKAELEASIARRLKSAEEQIASAEAGAVKQVRDHAIQVAVAAATDVMSKQFSAADKAGSIDVALADIKARLN